MTLAASMSTFDRWFIVAIAVAGLLGVIAASIVMLGQRRLAGRPIEPGPRLGRDVSTALTHPAYAPGYENDASRIDYVARVVKHQQCDAWPCPHIAVNTQHCRCGQPWVCAMAGPLNTALGEIPNQRNRNDERRWP